jgi:glycosyltransferase involved in cell wall biosynthesis
LPDEEPPIDSTAATRTRRRRRIKVLTLINYLFASGGGAERIAAVLALGLDRTRFDPIACTTSDLPEASAAGELRAAGIPVVALDRSGRADLAAWPRLYRLLRDEQVDVVHAHKFASTFYGAVLGRLARVPVVIAHEHSWSFEGNHVQQVLDRRVVAPLADVVVAVSREERRKLVELEGIPPEVIRVVPNGIRPLRPSGRRSVRAELGLAADTPLVGCVSVLRPEKAVDLLVEAAVPLAERVPGVRVAVVGGGPEHERLDALVRERGLERTVHLLGAWPGADVADFLAELDVAVNCSDREGIPLSVLEYMAAGRAVVATAVGGVPEVLGEGEAGLLVPARDAEGLAGAAASLLLDRPRRDRLGLRARARQEATFSERAMVERVERLYEELVRARATPPPPCGAPPTRAPWRGRRRATSAGSTAPSA